MARRKKDDDWIWAIAQLAGLFVALGFIYPPLLLSSRFSSLC